VKSKLISNTVRRMKELEEYHTEECDGKTQHWVSAKEGYLFPETETTSICGFDARHVNGLIKVTCKASDFYVD